MIAFRSASEVRVQLHKQFPLLAHADWSINSPWDTEYQCIAWAACHTNRVWWPWDHPRFYWPPGFLKLPIYSAVPVTHFAEMFEKKFGYKICDNPAFEFGYQKIAIYADSNGVTHMARQHFLGRGWLSKLGQEEDIVHRSARDVEDDANTTTVAYGTVAQYMKRNWWTALKTLCLFRASGRR